VSDRTQNKTTLPEPDGRQERSRGPIRASRPESAVRQTDSNYRTVVLSVDFRVVATSPLGVTETPVLLERLLSITTPLLSIVR
jgi:hypothetical protein